MSPLVLFRKDRSHIQTKMYFFPFFLVSYPCRYVKRCKIIKAKMELSPRHASSYGPHFLVWASLKQKIIPGPFHSISQWHRLQIYIQRGKKLTGLPHVGKTYPNLQTFLRWVLEWEIWTKTTHPYKPRVYRSHRPLRACSAFGSESPSVRHWTQRTRSHGPEQTNFPLPDPPKPPGNLVFLWFTAPRAPLFWVYSQHLQSNPFLIFASSDKNPHWAFSHA